MLFSSYEFILGFLPLCALGYFLLAQWGLKLSAKIWLIFMSYFFFAWYNPKYLLLIVPSIFFNYFSGIWVNPHQSRLSSLIRKLYYIFALAVNVGLLIYFKYADFLIESTNTVLGTQYGLLKVALPLGISFFTFQKVAYLTDCYFGKVRESDFLSFNLFVTFFPQLIAGPIVHHSEVMGQFDDHKKRSIQWPNISSGLFIFMLGLFKKTAIADTFAQWASYGHNRADTLIFFEGWLATLAYTFQLYFDFSGYSDMAIGAARIFNIQLPTNFNSPYKAQSIQDFWRRWHMTLSRFLRDYIYIPLGGNRGKESRISYNLFMTFLIGGIWHGAAWNFVIWGALHGVGVVLHRAWRRFADLRKVEMPKVLAWAATFLFVHFCWIFFRAKTVHESTHLVKLLLGFTGHKPHLRDTLDRLHGWPNAQWMPVFMLGAVIMLMQKNTLELEKKFKPNAFYAIWVIFCFVVCMLKMNEYAEFIYFTF